jgi:hypothetical protein
MNRKQLRKQKGQTRLLRPIPVDATGSEIDDPWLATDANNDGLHLHNQRTHHNLTIGFDHIIEYRTPIF